MRHTTNRSISFKAGHLPSCAVHGVAACTHPVSACPETLPRLTVCGHPSPRRSLLNGFSIIELTLVIGVLSLLLAIVLPTIKTVHAAVLKKQAAAEATALVQAAIRYKAEYGFWPGQLQEKDADKLTVELRSEFTGRDWIPLIISRPDADFEVESNESGFPTVYLDKNEVFQALRRIGEKQGTTFKANPLNPKGIHFLDLTEETDKNRVSFPDPWGNNYVLFMGLNPRSSFTMSFKVCPLFERQFLRTEGCSIISFHM